MSFKPSEATIFVDDYFNRKMLANLGYRFNTPLHDKDVEIYGVIEAEIASYRPSKKGK